MSDQQKLLKDRLGGILSNLWHNRNNPLNRNCVELFPPQQLGIATEESNTIPTSIEGNSHPDAQIGKLLDGVPTLTKQHHYHTAMDHILSALKQYPNNKQILEYAAIVIRSAVVDENSYLAGQIGEALTQAQYNDRLLDSIFCECELCGSTWAPDPFAADYRQTIVFNPTGSQCPKCNTVFCRRCSEMAYTDYICPKCGTKSVPIQRANGRKPRQLQRHSEKVQFAIVLREGPIAPDSDSLREFLEIISPDILEDAAVDIAIGVFSWSDAEINTIIAQQLATWKIMLRPDSMVTNSVQKDGLRHIIARIYHPDIISGYSLESKYTGKLNCLHCGMPNVSGKWPRNGDNIPFRSQSPLETIQNPGFYRLSIICPHCRKEWYIIWDDNPL